MFPGLFSLTSVLQERYKLNTVRDGMVCNYHIRRAYYTWTIFSPVVPADYDEGNWFIVDIRNHWRENDVFL
jgi:hypothetical protein